jgi:hypothetical protein
MKKVINALLCLAMLLNLCAVSAFAADGTALSFTNRGYTGISAADDDGYYTLSAVGATNQISYYANTDKVYTTDDSDLPAYIAVAQHINITNSNVNKIEIVTNNKLSTNNGRKSQVAITPGEHDVVGIWNTADQTVNFYIDGTGMVSWNNATGITPFAGVCIWFTATQDLAVGDEVAKVKGNFKTYDSSYDESTILLKLSGGAVSFTPAKRNDYTQEPVEIDGGWSIRRGTVATYGQSPFQMKSSDFTQSSPVKYVALNVKINPTNSAIRGKSLEYGVLKGGYAYTTRNLCFTTTPNEEFYVTVIWDKAAKTAYIYHQNIKLYTFTDVESFNGMYIYVNYNSDDVAEGDELLTMSFEGKAYFDETFGEVLEEYLPEKQSLSFTVTGAAANGDGTYSFTKTDSSTETTNAQIKLSSSVPVYTSAECTERLVAYKFTLTPRVRTSTSQIRLRFATSANSYNYSSTIDSFSGRLPSISVIDKPYEVVAIWDLVNNNDTFYVNGVKIGSGAHVGTIDNIQIMRVMMSGASVVDTFDISDVSATVYRGSYNSVDKVVSELIPDGVSDFALNFAEISDGVLNYEYFGNLSDSTAFAAGYDSANELSGFYGTNSTYERGKIQGSVKVDDAKAIKLFIWNMDTIEPLMSATTVR